MMDVFEASGLIEQIPVVDSFSPEGLVAEVADSPSRQVWLIPDEAHRYFSPCPAGTTWRALGQCCRKWLMDG